MKSNRERGLLFQAIKPLIPLIGFVIAFNALLHGALSGKHRLLHIESMGQTEMGIPGQKEMGAGLCALSESWKNVMKASLKMAGPPEISPGLLSSSLQNSGQILVLKAFGTEEGIIDFCESFIACAKGKARLLSLSSPSGDQERADFSLPAPKGCLRMEFLLTPAEDKQ